MTFLTHISYINMALKETGYNSKIKLVNDYEHLNDITANLNI